MDTILDPREKKVSVVTVASSPVDTEVSSTKSDAGYKGLLKEPYVLGLACFASIGGILFGYDLGVISGVMTMSSFSREFPSLTSEVTLKGWMVSVLTLGATFGSFSNGPLADHLSRRWAILLGAAIHTVGTIIQAAAVEMAMVFVGRVVTGFSVGMLSMVVPLYLGELAPPHLRGSLVTLQQLGATFGVMIVYWINYGMAQVGEGSPDQSSLAWRLPFALPCVPSVVLGLGTLWLPYSPRWLMMKGREREAAASLSKVRRIPVDDLRIQQEMLEIKAAQAADNERLAAKFPGMKSGPRLVLAQYAELVTVAHLRRRLVLSCLLQLLQQMSGINAIIFFAPAIFSVTGLSGNSISLLATGVVGIINFLATIPAAMYLDRWGRRPLLLAGAVGMSVCQFMVATLYAVYQYSWADHPAAGWATAVFVWLYVINFAFSVGCVGWIIPSEIFPPSVRSKAVGLSVGTAWLFSFIIALITPPLLEGIKFGTFYFFCGFCVILVFWVYFCVPETRGLRMEEMDRLFGGDNEATPRREGGNNGGVGSSSSTERTRRRFGVPWGV